MAAPSSAQTSPSQKANPAPTSQPSIACGPPIAESKSGMVMYGPMPIMSVMASAVAWTSPSSRRKPGLPVVSTNRHLFMFGRC